MYRPPSCMSPCITRDEHQEKRYVRVTGFRICMWNFKQRYVLRHTGYYLGADKSLARPGRKQARKHVRDAREFNNIETLAIIKFFFFPARQGAEGNSHHSDRNISLFPSRWG